uniref:Gypsy retrotransposon integrase-like protein 1 n=1 Tax=Oreochromis niloticus TaxID=8128 RepID=A0A669DK63_ORENI
MLSLLVYVKDHSLMPGLFCLDLVIRFPLVSLPSVSPSVCLCLYCGVSSCALFLLLVFYSVMFIYVSPARRVCSLPRVPSLPFVCLFSTPASCFLFYCEGLVFPCSFCLNSCEFRWNKELENEWQQLKKTLTTETVLAYFDPKKQTNVSTDASKAGIGAVLLQAYGDHWRPVAYASRAMTETESRYTQIEKETLGLVFGFEKFHTYVCGLPTFVAETDHKPLIAIIKKNLSEMSPRIQRLMMKLQRYDFNLIYTPGKHIVLADALSRARTPNKEQSSTEMDVNIHLNLVAESLPMSDRKSHQIKAETQKDSSLQRVITLLNGKWPRGECKTYYNIRAELSVVNGLLLRQNRVVIPHSLRGDILKRLHERHLGIEKCKRRARTAVYWPGINADIEKMVSTCDTCIKEKREFQLFAQEYDFKHVTSSPLHPQSNGKAEKGVHIVKQLLKKAQDSKADPYLALLSYRASPLEHGKSPAEILMGRKLQTTLPYTTTRKHKQVRDKMKQLQKRQKVNFDKSSKSLKPLAPNEAVRVEDANVWTKRATVLEEVNPRSYNVKTEDGLILRRNRRSLLYTQKTMGPSEGQCDDNNTPPEPTTPVKDSVEQRDQSPIVRRSARSIKPPDRLNLLAYIYTYIKKELSALLCV